LCRTADSVLWPEGGLRDFGRGVRSQNVSGTNRNNSDNPNPASIATTLKVGEPENAGNALA
jgi:hypothetical protein